MEWTRGPTIGRGATAIVHLATKNRTGELFAVKSTELSQSTFLQREQSFLSKIASPRIINYLGFSITTESTNKNTPMYNLFLEYFPSGTLFDLIQDRGKLEEPKMKLYASQILRGLEYLHRNGIVHCDIKSRNVLIGEDGAKIGDLGSAKRVEESDLDHPNFSGTPSFMAPEVARGERQGLEADVWALGCVVVEMGSGGGPWPDMGAPVSAMYRIGFSDFVPEIPRWLSEQGKDFLGKCFERDWRKRPTVRELLEHPFVLEGFGFEMISPSSVLVKDFLWDFEEVVCESQRETECSVLSSAQDRIRGLIGDNEVFSSWDFFESHDDEDWLIIRSNEDSDHEEKEEEEDAFDEFFFDPGHDDQLSIFEFSIEIQNSAFSDTTSFVMPCNNIELQSEMRNQIFSFGSILVLHFYNLNFMGFFIFCFFHPYNPKGKKIIFK